MSEASGGARDGTFDAAIDRAVREMLDVEPPAGLRRRVLERVDARSTRPLTPHSGQWRWLAPVAAAAIVILAVWLPRAARESVGTSNGHSGVDVRLPVEGPRTMPSLMATAPPPARPRAPRGGRIAAASVAADAGVAVTEVEALPGPPSIAVDQLASLARPAVTGLAVTALEVRPLNVDALSDAPRERRDEE